MIRTGIGPRLRGRPLAAPAVLLAGVLLLAGCSSDGDARSGGAAPTSAGGSASAGGPTAASGARVGGHLARPGGKEAYACLRNLRAPTPAIPARAAAR
ncbi:hypothetical protein ACWGB8_03760 [Kitasatospora sp. NPDC054939]